MNWFLRMKMLGRKPARPVVKEELTDANIQRALGEINIDHVTMYKFSGVVNWRFARELNLKNSMVDPVNISLIKECRDAVDKLLSPVGAEMAFIAMMPINAAQYDPIKRTVIAPKYDANGTAAVGTIGVWGADGKLKTIDINNAWKCINNWGASDGRPVDILASMCCMAFFCVENPDTCMGFVKPYVQESVTDAALQRALGRHVNLSNVLVRRYDTRQWNTKNYAGCLDKSSVPTWNDNADKFKAHADSVLTHTGNTVAFIAVMQIADKNNMIPWGMPVKKPVYDKHGRTAVGVVGVWGADGKLKNVDSQKDWHKFAQYKNVSELAKLIGVDFANCGNAYAGFCKDLVSRHMENGK